MQDFDKKKKTINFVREINEYPNQRIGRLNIIEFNSLHIDI